MIGTFSAFPTASIRLTQIYRGSDDSKIEPVCGTDVSIERGPYVKSYDDLELWLAIATKRFCRLNGLDRCGECVLGRGTDQVGTLNWKKSKADRRQ